VPLDIKLVAPASENTLDQEIVAVRDHIEEVYKNSTNHRGKLRFKFMNYVKKNGDEVVKKLVIGFGFVIGVTIIIAVAILIIRQRTVQRPAPAPSKEINYSSDEESYQLRTPPTVRFYEHSPRH